MPGAPVAVSLKAAASLRESGSEARARAVLFARRPDSIRVEIYGPMNRVAAVLAGDRENCFIYQGGVVSGCEWGRGELIYLGDPARVVSLLLGDRQGVSAGGAATTMRADDYRPVDGVPIPFHIVIEKSGKRLEMEYDSAELNPVLDEGLFRLR